MKIALVTNCFLPNTGGGEFVVHHLANQWAKQGHEVCVFNSMTNEATHPEALYKVRRYTIMRGATRFGYHRFPWVNITTRSLNKLINEFNPDFISGHFAYPVGIYLSRLLPKRDWIITGHGADILANLPDSQRDKYQIDDLLKDALSSAKKIVSISPLAEQSLCQIGISNDKITYIPNGADLEKFENKAKSDFRAIVGLPVNAEFVLTIARNFPQKNLELGIKSFAELTDKFPDLYYVIVGQGANKLSQVSAAYHVEHKVVLLDRLQGEDLLSAYQQATVFLSTSIWEFCPLVILESMAAGLPQIATNVPGNSDFIDDGVTGLLVELNDHQAMAKAIADFLDNGELQKQMKASNLTKAKAFSWEKISKQYLELASDKQQPFNVVGIPSKV